MAKEPSILLPVLIGGLAYRGMLRYARGPRRLPTMPIGSAGPATKLVLQLTLYLLGQVACCLTESMLRITKRIAVVVTSTGQPKVIVLFN